MGDREYFILELQRYLSHSSISVLNLKTSERHLRERSPWRFRSISLDGLKLNPVRQNVRRVVQMRNGGPCLEGLIEQATK